MKFSRDWNKWNTPQRNMLVGYVWATSMAASKEVKGTLDLKLAHETTVWTLKDFQKNGVSEDLIDEMKMIDLYVKGTFGK